MSWIIQALTTVGAIFKYGWPFMILIALLIAKLKGKNWPLEVIMIEKRGNNLIKTNDRAGMYDDKFTGLKGYKLLTTGDTLPVVEYDWILHNNFKPTIILDRLIKIIRPTVGTLFLYKYGSKQYKPIYTKINEKTKIELKEIKDADGNSILYENYNQFDPRGALESLEFEVVDWDNMNFMVQEMRASIERRRKKGEWMKTILIPMAALAVSAMISIIMIKFGYDSGIALSHNTGNPIPPQPATTPNIPGLGDVIPGQ